MTVVVLFNFFLLVFHCFIHFSMNCLQDKWWNLETQVFPHIPLILPGIDHTDRIFRISSSQIEMVSSLRYDQSCGSSHRLEHSSAGPGVKQPVGEDNVGRRLEASSSVQGVGKGWPREIQFSKD